MIKFLRTFMRAWNETRNTPPSLGPARTWYARGDSPFSWADSTFSVEVTKASNGHVLAVRRYDHRNDKSEFVIRVCPAETPLHEEFAALFAEHRLTKG